MPKSCNKNGCDKHHHMLLHREDETAIESDAVLVEKASVCTTSRMRRKAVRLGIVPVKVETPLGLIATLAFLDTGSDTTLVKQQFVNDHCLMNNSCSLTMTTLGGTSTSSCLKGQLKLFSLDERNVIVVDEAYTVQDIPIRPTQSINDEASKWKHLSDIYFDELPDSEVSILLGCDVPEAHWPLDQRIYTGKQPYAIKTLLGWVMYVPLNRNRNATPMFASINGSDVTISEQLRMLYDHEFADSSDNCENLSRNDRLAVQLAESRSRFTDGHLEIPLPWNLSSPQLPNNYSEALKRLSFLRRRLLREESLCEKYKAGMRKYVDKGYLELVTSKMSDNTVVWYMPHHGVFHPKKPDKLRIVFDCAAKYHGLSLNDVILSGPDLTSPLLHVLLRFRVHPVAVTADIEEMFLQVRVPVADRDALRIFWWSDPELNGNPATYRMTVHPFGVTSSPFCANFALQRALEQLGSQYGINAQTVCRSFYVDDFLVSQPDCKSTLDLIKGVTAALAQAGFRLTKWTSNHRDILQHIPQNERAANFKDLDVTNFPAGRTLGIEWDANTDKFLFSFNLKNRAWTRRGLLSTIAGLYDPLGFVSPWVMPGKILLQTLCRKGIAWDDALCEFDEQQLQKWLKILRHLNNFRVPRCLTTLPMHLSNAELHIFEDASETGYGTVAYACFDNSAVRSTALLLSKARVAPLKAVSLPRLELSAAVLAVRIYEIIKHAEFINFDRVVFWSDSTIVLYYIRNTSTRFCTFVANRLAIIHDNTNEKQWRYVPSSLNQADKLSRGISCPDDGKSWLSGPAFLKNPEHEWPNIQSEKIDESEIECKKKVAIVNLVSKETFWQTIWQHYSRWKTLVRALTWLSRFKTYWMIMNAKRQTHTLTLGPLTIKEMLLIETQLISVTQEQCFSSDLANLTASGKIEKDSKIRRLSPFISGGLIRVRSRLTFASVADDVKYPIILPSKHHITNLIINYYHELEGHAGYNHVSAAIRQKFWIVHGAAAIKRVLKVCPTCRRLNAIPSRQLMAPLPAFRVEPGWFPFTHVGMDYFGPLLIKHGRSLEKRYGCLFTCLKSRAVHIEVVHSLTTDSFIMILIRFIARRGHPTDIYSDNGSNFVGAQRELRNWITNLDQETISRRLSFKDVQWHFNPPQASHRGGVWERIIRSIRKIFADICTEQSITDEVLLTFLIETERILNSRPIVPISSDDINSIALTPNDLLLLRNNSGIQLKDCLLERYKARWKQANHMAGDFGKDGPKNISQLYFFVKDG